MDTIVVKPQTFCIAILTLFHCSSVLAEGVQCGQPGRPVNGTVTPSGKQYFPGEKITYSCLEGFVLFGEEGRTCLKNGTWSGDVPLCDFNLAKGKRTLQSATLWSYAPGLAVDGNKDTCSFTPKGPEPRWWQVHLGHKFNVVSIGVTISPGSFQEFTIFVIELLSNNKALYKPCTEFKGVFQTHKGLFKCNDGLGHPGQYVYIRDDRKEEQYFGLCEVEVFAFRERIPCGDPGVPISGGVSREGENRAVYTCERGHKLEGDSVLMCSSKGTWQGQTPRCSEVKCNAPRHIENGFIEIGNPRGEYVYGIEANYGCSPGFVLKGAARRVCEHEGDWSEEAPTCQAVTCGDPPVFENAKFTFLNGSTSQWTGIVVYTCLDGFKLAQATEDTVTTCLDTGNWRPINVTCIPLTTTLEFVVRESGSRSLDYLETVQSNDDVPHLVIALAVIAGVLAAGMIVFGVLLLRRRLLSSPAGSLNPLVIRQHDGEGSHLKSVTEGGISAPHASVELSRPGSIPIPYLEVPPLAIDPQHQFHSNLLQTITQKDYRNSYRTYGCGASTSSSSSSGAEPPYERVARPPEHSYETLLKKGRNMGYSQDSNYECASSDKDSVGYETVACPKELPGYETVREGGDPGYEVVKDGVEPGYETVQGEELSEPGYEVVRQLPEPGYEVVNNDSKKVHGYETLKPKLPPREAEYISESEMPDILQNIDHTDAGPAYQVPGSQESSNSSGNTGDIPAEILALYAKVDKSKKNRKPTPLSSLQTPSPPVPANHPVLDPKRVSNASSSSTSVGGSSKTNAKELIRKFNSLTSEDEDDSKSVSPPHSLHSEGATPRSSSSLGGLLRPLPPLPQ